MFKIIQLFSAWSQEISDDKYCIYMNIDQSYKSNVMEYGHKDFLMRCKSQMT